MTPWNRPRVGRPFGQCSQALLSAAAQGPAPMCTLAARAQVGYDVARHKVPALARAGALVALNQDRPRVYALPTQPCAAADDALGGAGGFVLEHRGV